MTKWLVSLVFIALCLGVLIPYTSYKWMYSVSLSQARPAGPISEGFSINQAVVIPKDKKADCVGIYFATYARNNSNHLVVTLEDGSNRAAWAVSSKTLADNNYHYFCPGWPLGIHSRLHVSLRGVDGSDANSPTVWLTADEDGGVADVNGTLVNQGITFALADRVEVSAFSLLHKAHGAFIIGWLATLLMGLVGINAGLAENRQR